MSATLTREPKAARRPGFPPDFKRATTVYAITIQLAGGPPDADRDITRRLADHQFERQAGGLYLGGPKVTCVTAVLAVTDLARSLPWFAASVRDIRLLRIEEFNDLMPVIRRLAVP